MRRANLLCLVLGGLLMANGLWMILGPAGWYATVPGPSGTGPLNAHFVRDIGAAYATAGGALAWSGFAGAAAAALAASGGGFLGLHALIHIGERLAGLHRGLHDIGPELALVWLPPLVVLALAWRLRGPAREVGHG